MKQLHALSLFIVISLCSPAWGQVDKKANSATRDLFKRLTKISKDYKTDQKILLGQQNAFNEGRGWRYHDKELGSALRSDMHDVAGVHPSVYGVDLDEIGHWNQKFIIERMEMLAKRGGVTTLSWHMRNPLNARSSSDFKLSPHKVVEKILPGGSHHEVYKKELDRLVSFMKSVEHLPIILRPFHEHTGSWFWWGQRHTTTQDFISLWRFTIDYLKQNQVHNFLIAYSPANITKDYFERYPGDDYVDILGVDTYFRNRVSDLFEHSPVSAQLNWKKDVIWLMKEASKRQKIPAITEFGQEAVVYEDFWTDYFSWPLEKEGLLQHLKPSELPEYGIAYIMLWRNDKTDKKHYYGPIIGHKNNPNFLDMLSKKIYLTL